MTENEIVAALKKALKLALQNKPVIAELSALSPEPMDGTEGVPPPDSESGLQDPKLFNLRMPKPVLSSKKERAVLISSGVRVQAYTFEVKNWASFPDDLFEKVKGIPPCKGQIMSAAILGPASQGNIAPVPMAVAVPKSSRLELSILGEEDQVIFSSCSAAKPESLRAIPVTMPDRSRIEKVRIQIKDRLTGNSVQSDPMDLW
jgi:hypothetical protein